MENFSIIQVIFLLVFGVTKRWFQHVPLLFLCQSRNKMGSSQNLEHGIEFSILNGKLEGSAEYYVKIRMNLLVRVPVSVIFGAGQETSPIRG